MQLITGGMGFIGLHTARSFLDAGEEVVITRFRTAREPDFIRGEIGKRLFVAPLDLTEAGALTRIAREYAVTGIVHLAVPALRGPTQAEEFQTNMTGLIGVLEAAREVGVRRLAIASSVAVYNGLAAGPFTEDMALPLIPRNPTDAYKKCFEILSAHYADATALEIVAMRIGLVYGPLYHSLANLPSRLVHAAVRGEPGPLPATARPSPHEGDFLDAFYVRDCGRAIQTLQSAPQLKHRVYNLSGGQVLTAGEMAAAVKAIVPDAVIDLAPGQGPRARADAWADISRLQGELGFEPEYTVVKGIADYIGWLRAGNER